MQEQKRSFWSYLIIGIKGLLIGAVDWVPGVSGGTIAFITGVYRELLYSIKSISPSLLALLFRGKWGAFWKQLNGWFLLALGCGILTSVFSIAKLLQYLIKAYPVPVWSLFTGLVVAAAIYVLKGLKKWNIWNIVVFLASMVLAIIICKVSPSQTPNDYWFIFLTGAIAICAMLMPGISGAFVMVLMGKYQFILDAISGLYWDVLLAFAAGAVVGVMASSRLLYWLLDRYYSKMVCLMAGFMFGSLEKLWPGNHAELSGNPAFMATIPLFILLGFVLVFGLEFLAAKMKKQTR
ncbi:MAG: DUF368 domain-containing protein [Bacteroidales bacterium]|nr:DUF368 domain-containing protein [Bacteroidales bacterium]MCL2738617.1 DUF368 domain-containing protein [Bacteroidales bacterium]